MWPFIQRVVSRSGNRCSGHAATLGQGGGRARALCVQHHHHTSYPRVRTAVSVPASTVAAVKAVSVPASTASTVTAVSVPASTVAAVNSRANTQAPLSAARVHAIRAGAGRRASSPFSTSAITSGGEQGYEQGTWFEGKRRRHRFYYYFVNHDGRLFLVNCVKSCLLACVHCEVVVPRAVASSYVPLASAGRKVHTH